MDFIGGLPPERTIIMKIMTQDKTRVLNFKMTYISYVSKNRICEGDFGIALLLFVIVCELAAIYDRQNGGK